MSPASTAASRRGPHPAEIGTATVVSPAFSKSKVNLYVSPLVIGFVSAKQSIPALAMTLAAAAITGGAIGSYLGSRRFPVRAISILLATVLVIAGAKLIFTK